MVGGAGCQGHEGEGWVLVASGSHAGAVGDEDVAAGMELIPFVEQGGFGVFAHADATYFVDVEARILAVVEAVDVLTACGFEHFGALGEEIGGHLIIVVIVGDGGDELGDTPFVVLVGAEPDMVLELWDRFALHSHIDEPGAGFGDGIFPGSADAGFVHSLAPAGAACPEIAHIPSLEAEALVFVQVAERGDKDLGGAAAVVIAVGEPVEFSAYIAAVVVEGDVVAEEAVIVAESVGEAGGF